MKKVLCAIISAVMVLSMFASCKKDTTPDNSTNTVSVSSNVESNKAETKDTAQTGSVQEDKADSEEKADSKKNDDSETDKKVEEEDPHAHTLYFRDGTKSDKAVATFFNIASGETKDVEMKKIKEEDDAYTFSCVGDTTIYNMAYVTYGENKTIKFAFNRCTSGWCRDGEDLFPYLEGQEVDYTAEFEDLTLTDYGLEKKIHIWTPDDYDPNSSEKYATIYILDGQIAGNFGLEGMAPMRCPGHVEQTRIMEGVTGYKAIVVAIENLDREFELVPDITMSAEEKAKVRKEGQETSQKGVDEDTDLEAMSGVQFACFVADTLVPYIQKNYNVYDDALHTAITGHSIGGWEALYIGSEFPEVFGTIGGLSPALYQFKDKEWREYYKDKKMDETSPFIFFYTGPEMIDTDPDVTEMYNRLLDMGYPKDKLVLHFNEEGTHAAGFWRAVFSEFLTAMAYQRIEPLQK